MKRKLIFVLFLCLLIVLSLIACDDSSKSLFEPEKDPVINNETTVETDANVKIDSYDNDEVYKGQKVITFTETLSEITCTSKAFLGEKGIYLYAYVEDPNVYYSDERQIYENDSVEFYIDPRPEYSSSVEHLNSGKDVRTDCVQVRVSVMGDVQTWVGRQIGGADAYPWAPGYFDTVAKTRVDGKLNEQNGAKGYGVEVFIPYYEMMLDAKPEEIGVLVAFNNIDNREDTGRIWYSYKGMSHSKLSSYIPVREDGYQVPEYTSKKELTADYNDVYYNGLNELKLYQVDANNENATERASFKFALGDDGIYLTALVKDKVYSYKYDNIFANDGIEVLVDTRDGVSDTIFEDGVYRFSYDVAAGSQTDKCINGYDDYVSEFNPTLVKTKIEDYTDTSKFKYRYQYTYEVMIPYEVLGLSSRPDSLKVAFAVKTPNEEAYILDRRDGDGQMEGQDWLWVDKHYPQNPNEYYLLTNAGIVTNPNENFEFNWSNVSSSSLQSDCPTRYNYKGYAADDGLYINMIQYVDTISHGGTGGDWKNSTHIEMEIWNHGIGYGWDGTYFAFFTDGSYYVNNSKGINKIVNKVSITTDENAEFLYTISYEVYIGFNNNTENKNEDPYGYVQFMSHTPNEGTDGYEKASMITKDGNRMLWTDDCNSYGFSTTGINTVDRANTANSALDTYYVVDGGYKKMNNKLLFTEYNSLVLCNDVYTGAVSFKSKIMANSISPAGIVFDYTTNGFYYFAIDNRTHEAVLYKVTDSQVVEIERNYISASYKNNLSYDMNVEVINGKYYCTFFNTLYFTGDLENNSMVFGFASSVPGAQFYDISMDNYVTDKDVETLIIGHSYTELWTNYKMDLGSLGLSTEEILNIGISGSHSMHWNKLEEEILAYSPELLIYNIGINDLFYTSATPRQIADNIKELLVNLKAKKTDLEVALLSLNHCATSGHIAQLIIETNNYLKELSTEYTWIKYVDLEDAFYSSNGKIDESLFTDGLHPTANAYREVMLPKIADALGLSIYNDVLEQNWENYVTTVIASSPERYQVIAHTSADGLYIKVEQYVNDYVIATISSDWNSTHVEMELWNHCIGYGWDGTYFAFFADGSYYINNWRNCSGVYNHAKITENASGSTYKYTITYNIYIAFPNNLDHPEDDSYAYCQFMFLTPGEDNSGYENSITITKDGNRVLWTDNCNSYEIHSNGITKKDGEK